MLVKRTSPVTHRVPEEFWKHRKVIGFWKCGTESETLE